MIRKFFICSILFNCLLSTNSLAQERKPILGEIELENYEIIQETDADRRKRNVEYLQNLLTQFKNLKEGQVAPLPKMSKSEDDESPLNFTDHALNHLAVAYLRCSVAEGTCPAVLDAILEVDIVNSKLAGEAGCPNMQKFWRLWIENDMEKRHQHQVQIGYLKATENFNRDVRPTYIKCKDTVAAVLAKETVGNSEFLKKRYADGKQLESIQTTLNLLEVLEKSGEPAFDLKK